MIFRKATAENVILGILVRHPYSTAARISKIANIGSALLYPTLQRLEREGWVWADWHDEPYPRRRYYRLATVYEPEMAQSTDAKIIVR